MHYECKYCDSPFGPAVVDGDKVCSNCGAEWEAAKILINGESDES